MAVAETTCTADPTRDPMRRWLKHRWTCATCTEEIRWYTGLGWHHYTPRPMTGIVFTDAAGDQDAEVTAMVPPRLHLVPPLAATVTSCTNTQCPCNLHAVSSVPEQSSIVLAA